MLLKRKSETPVTRKRNGTRGKEWRTKIGAPGLLDKQRLILKLNLEDCWSCAGGLSIVNAIGTQLRDPINSNRD